MIISKTGIIPEIIKSINMLRILTSTGFVPKYVNMFKIEIYRKPGLTFKKNLSITV